jgi:anti-anti-sigma factor
MAMYESQPSDGPVSVTAPPATRVFGRPDVGGSPLLPVKLCIRPGSDRPEAVINAETGSTSETPEDDGPVDLQSRLKLTGPIDLGTSGRTMRELCDAVDHVRLRLLVDLSSVETINTTGVLVLDAAERYARQLNREVVIVGAKEDVIRVIDRVGLSRLLRSSMGAA